VDDPVAGTTACDCEVAGLELVVEDEVGAGVTSVGVAALVLAADDGAVGATAAGVAAAPDADAAVVALVAAVVALLAAVVALLVDEVEVGVEPIVEVDPVVPAGAVAAASVSAVTISPLVGVSERNDDELGAWMFETARPGLPSALAARKPTACGGGITMPIDPASCWIR
jgi:hypothetical protein